MKNLVLTSFPPSLIYTTEVSLLMSFGRAIVRLPVGSARAGELGLPRSSRLWGQEAVRGLIAMY